jgi:hypothetical protein
MVQYLVQDTLGWPQAAIQLGGYLASIENLQDRSSLDKAEDGCYETLSTRYSTKYVDEFGVLAAKKLFCLALAPISVRTVRENSFSVRHSRYSL